ncbi:MAG: methylated-DNA--[protein]-cysteine S-methyltransferase [Clostridia bacterium]|nr:methylated-DNA--[protein]-cysteine S-methyltransferase [Clostridia bacterium]
MDSVYYYDFPLCRLGIVADESAISQIFFSHGNDNFPAPLQETPLIQEAAEQLRQYFAGQRREFDLPLAPHGTPFQKKIWQLLMTIPHGETRSYKQIAALAGNEKATRAVGGANNRNPIAIVIPCHRVIGADGSLVGYGGLQGLGLKRQLLDLEKAAGR